MEINTVYISLKDYHFNRTDWLRDGIYENFGLEKIKDKVKVFFYDEINSTYYVEDEHIEEFLEEANKWYLKAKNKVDEYKKEQEIKELKEKLAELVKENS